MRREVVKAFGRFQAELAFGVHLENARFCQPNQTWLRPGGIRAAVRGTGVDANLTGRKEIRCAVETIDNPLFVLRQSFVSATQGKS